MGSYKVQIQKEGENTIRVFHVPSEVDKHRAIISLVKFVDSNFKSAKFTFRHVGIT